MIGETFSQNSPLFNKSLIFIPKTVNVPIIPTAINSKIKAYSIAVAPFKKQKSNQL